MAQPLDCCVIQPIDCQGPFWWRVLATGLKQWPNGLSESTGPLIWSAPEAFQFDKAVWQASLKSDKLAGVLDGASLIDRLAI